MTEEQLRAMSEQEIRARFRHAPAYYLQAKLEKKRALDGRRKQARTAPESSREAAPPEPSQWRASPPEPESLDLRFAPSERAKRTSLANEGLNLPLPGFEILDAALCESEGPLEDPDDSLAEPLDTDTGLTQQAILETALEDYSNWPFRSTPEPSSEPEPLPRPESELERKLTLVL
jgi:hypothetical protein